jgi:ABC-type transport system involved in cytochrome c biogenesis ATPase subunit
MITSVYFCLPHSLKIKGPRDMHFEPGVNVLVGPNGSGKSTALRAIASCGECRKETDGPCQLRLFNSETMNPHSDNRPAGDLRNLILRSRGVFSSHGEIMKVALSSLPIATGDILLIDEPEAGQDAAGIEHIREGLEAICEQGGQVIAASHDPLIWQNAHLIEMTPDYVEQVKARYCESTCPNEDRP